MQIINDSTFSVNGQKEIKVIGIRTVFSLIPHKGIYIVFYRSYQTYLEFISDSWILSPNHPRQIRKKSKSMNCNGIQCRVLSTKSHALVKSCHSYQTTLLFLSCLALYTIVMCIRSTKELGIWTGDILGLELVKEKKPYLRLV